MLPCAPSMPARKKLSSSFSALMSWQEPTLSELAFWSRGSLNAGKHTDKGATSLPPPPPPMDGPSAGPMRPSGGYDAAAAAYAAYGEEEEAPPPPPPPPSQPQVCTLLSHHLQLLMPCLLKHHTSLWPSFPMKLFQMTLVIWSLSFRLLQLLPLLKSSLPDLGSESFFMPSANTLPKQIHIAFARSDVSFFGESSLCFSYLRLSAFISNYVSNLDHHFPVSPSHVQLFC